MSPPALRAADLPHVRAPVPLRFPVSEAKPVGNGHTITRMFLHQLLSELLGPEHTVGSNQFMYWARNNPSRRLWPDAFVKLEVRQTMFGSWKCWERGAPHLAVEIISPVDWVPTPWDEKLGLYAEAGVEELVRFESDEASGQRIRAWDHNGNGLVERTVENDRTPCRTLATLGLHWAVGRVDRIVPVGLRLARGEGELVPTREEAETERRKVAEARVRELEEELRRRG